MSISLLKTLIAVADTGSFATAAAKVFVSQAAVGQQMRKLEQQLGVTLFDRTARSPQLTVLGEAVVSRARDVVDRYHGLLHGLVPGDDLLGELTVGAIPSQISALVPLSIRRMLADNPGLRTRVLSGLSDELQDLVERGAVDAAIISAPAYLPSEQRWMPFAQEEYVLITAPEETSTDVLHLLHNRPYIRHQRRTAAGILADGWLGQHAPQVQTAMEMQSLEALANMVAHGLGVSVVPAACVPDDRFSSLRQLPLPATPPHRRLGILTLATCPKRALVDALLDAVRETVRDHGNSKSLL